MPNRYHNFNNKYKKDLYLAITKIENHVKLLKDEYLNNTDTLEKMRTSENISKYHIERILISLNTITHESLRELNNISIYAKEKGILFTINVVRKSVSRHMRDLLETMAQRYKTLPGREPVESKETKE